MEMRDFRLERVIDDGKHRNRETVKLLASDEGPDVVHSSRFLSGLPWLSLNGASLVARARQPRAVHCAQHQQGRLASSESFDLPFGLHGFTTSAYFSTAPPSFVAPVNFFLVPAPKN